MRYTDRFEQAVTLALRAFREIDRKGSSVPYMTHLLSVTALVGEAGGDEDQLCAAVLHDLLEDIEGSRPLDIETQFGANVLRLVEALSDTTEFPKPPWRPRKERYIARMRVAGPDVRLICCADKHHNARSILRGLSQEGLAVFDVFSGGVDGTLWYYRAVADALSEGWSHWLLDELHATVGVLHQETQALLHP